MKKYEMKALLAGAIHPAKLCRVFLTYDRNYRYYFPLKISDRLFLGAEEDDFILDGYSIRRFRDVEKIEIKDDKCLEIDRAEGLLDQLVTPDVDLTDWRSVFASLDKISCHIIIQRERLDEENELFAIGRIMRVMSRHVLLKHFDADGNWQEECWAIPYSQITSVTFGSRYVEVFSKYLPPIS